MPENPITVGITGAGGFLGSAAVDFFLRNPLVKSVRSIYSHLPKSPIHSPKETQFVGELSDRNLCHAFLEGVDAVLHLANRGFPSDVIQTPGSVVIGNLQATATLLEAMKAHNVSRIVFSSTAGGLYQDAEKRRIPFTETAPVDLRSPYALSKVTLENLLLYYERAESFSPIILRVSNPFGEGQFGRARQGVVGVILHKLMTGTPLSIWGDLSTCKDYLYIEDCLSAFSASLLGEVPTGIYHVGSGVGTSLKELIEICESVTGKKLAMHFEKARKTDTDWMALNTSKFQKATGWHCRWSLTEGISECWETIHKKKEASERAAA